MSSIKVSLFASSVRPQLYDSFFKSLEGTSICFEVVFAGNWDFGPGIKLEAAKYINADNEVSMFHYYRTNNIKPAQCYEIARRHCKGETIMWVPDDAEFPNDVLGKAYKYWKSQNNRKLILSVQTKEYYLEKKKGTGLCDMTMHTFTGRSDAPLMAPLGLMSREYLEELGGIPVEYVCGQWDNDIVMSAYRDCAKVEIFGGKDCFIDIDHVGKNEIVTGERGFKAHRRRPFGTGYPHDREMLLNFWGQHGQREQRKYPVNSYEEKDILIKSQSHKGIWE